MTDQDRAEFEELTHGIPPCHHDYDMLLAGFNAGLAAARRTQDDRIAELEATIERLRARAANSHLVITPTLLREQQ